MGVYIRNFMRKHIQAIIGKSEGLMMQREAGGGFAFRLSSHHILLHPQWRRLSLPPDIEGNVAVGVVN